MPATKPLRIALALLAAAAFPALAARAVACEHGASGAVRPALSATSAAAPRTWSYGWPVKPFGRQHPVRGMFGDPRIGRAEDGSMSRQFHFGIDVSAPNGTPVYATQTGTVVLLHSDVVTVLSGNRELSYWHILPSVRTGQHAVAYRTVIGRIEKPWAHVHFSEEVGGAYLNPLRPGALGPYTDATHPHVTAIRAVGGDLVAELYDDTPLEVAAPWADKPVMPELVRFRLRGYGITPAWRTALDVRQTIPDRSRFFDVYAAGTRQNLASVRGRYRIYLARNLAQGHYVVEVAAFDGQGNETLAASRITVEPGL